MLELEQIQTKYRQTLDDLVENELKWRELRRLLKEWDVNYHSEYFSSGRMQRDLQSTFKKRTELLKRLDEFHQILDEDLPYLNQLLVEAAEKGEEQECIKLQQFGANNFEKMLKAGARGGHVKICTHAKEWGATNIEKMFQIGARYGHENICRLAKDWGAINIETMLQIGARYGHENICRFAKDLGATRFKLMLYHSRRGGNENISRLAKDWGALQ